MARRVSSGSETLLPVDLPVTARAVMVVMVVKGVQLMVMAEKVVRVPRARMLMDGQPVWTTIKAAMVDSNGATMAETRVKPMAP